MGILYCFSNVSYVWKLKFCQPFNILVSQGLCFVVVLPCKPNNKYGKMAFLIPSIYISCVFSIIHMTIRM